MKCGRGELTETLWGGISFKLTPAARKQAMNEYRRHLHTEKQVAFDVRYFAESLKSPADEDLKTIAEFLAGCERREALPLAYAVFSSLPPEKAKPYREILSKAKLAELRLMSE